ncbi:MAG: phosphoribosylanthranilate isomerase [Bacteroidales bacterium]
MTKIKICCIQNRREVDLAVEAGVDAIGLVSVMPSGPGVIDEDSIRELLDYARGRIERFLLTSSVSAVDITDQYHRFEPDTLQLVDSVSEDEYREIRKQISGVRLVQVIHVRGESAIEEARLYAGLADALLLDSGNPGLSVKSLGGTGKVHDWHISRKIVELVNVPVYLAGGLNPANIAEAVHTVKPHGVDVCSGIRRAGLLEEDMLKRFVDEVRR